MDRPDYTQRSGTIVKETYVLATANTDDATQEVFENQSGAAVKVTAIGFKPDVAVTGAATNNFILQFLTRLATGLAAHSLTAIKTYASGTDIAVHVLDQLVLSTTAADLIVEDGEKIVFAKTENGTGLTCPAGTCVVEYQFV